MSAKKRRIQRKLALVVRMDEQIRGYIRQGWKQQRCRRLQAAQKALGKKITRMGYGERGKAAVAASREARP
jgi:hypothetical protein